MSPIAVDLPPLSSPNFRPDIPRRPSPWHEIAHSLSETALPSSARRHSTSNAPTPPVASRTGVDRRESIDTIPSTPTISLSSSALREWDRLLSTGADVTRHQLIHPTSSPRLRHAKSGSSIGSHSASATAGPPKLAAERDKDGHIEYKLKLIDPTPERFDKLVTQMLWRLKQGRNEAIYELGLADDGTVVGLTRPEMDASLRTLELMASEVGATVIVLREVVLIGNSIPLQQRTPDLSISVSSSGASSEKTIHTNPDIGPAPSTWAWPVQRPDLGADGRPRAVSMGGRKGRNKARRERRASSKAQRREAEGNEDVPPFHLDLDSPPVSPVVHSELQHKEPSSERPSRRIERNSRRKRQGAASSRDNEHSPDIFAALPFSILYPRNQTHPNDDKSRKESAKAIKAAARREQRRLDLYRGDGTNERWLGMEHDRAETTSTCKSEHHGDEHVLQGTGTPPACIPPFHLPYKPARPSSLRLTTPAPTLATDALAIGLQDDPHPQTPPDPFLAELLLMPLDSLSLSFAEVRTVTDPYALYDAVSQIGLGSDGESEPDPLEQVGPPASSPPMSPLHAARDAVPYAIDTAPEMICVEALVVRKTAQGVAGVEDWCDGGQDAWGFGYGYEGECESDVIQEAEFLDEGDADPWGF